MTTGAIFRNDKGEVIADLGHVLYRKAKVTTHNDPSPAPPPGVSIYDQAIDYTHIPSHVVGSQRMVAGARTVIPRPGDPSYGVNHYPPIADFGDLIFLRPGATGFYRAVSIDLQIDGMTPAGVVGLVLADADIPAVIASPVPRPFVPETDHGIRLRADDGELLFDSRYPQISVFQSAYLVQADMLEILATGVSKYITLAKAVPDCLVCANYLVNEWLSGNAYVPNAAAMVGIRQSGPSQIEFYRKTLGSFSPAPGNMWKSYVSDSMILFAREAGS